MQFFSNNFREAQRTKRVDSVITKPSVKRRKLKIPSSRIKHVEETGVASISFCCAEVVSATQKTNREFDLTTESIVTSPLHGENQEFESLRAHRSFYKRLH